jgi:antitoxin component YwqK of YwqJK toxin-antitoxin module
MSINTMKNCLFLIGGFLFLLCNGFAQQTDSMRYVRFYYSDSVLSSEGWMRDDKPDGYWKSYYPNTIIKSEGNRENFSLDKVWKFYDNQGNLQSEITYQAGVKQGLNRRYSQDVIEEYTYVNDTIKGTARWLSYTGHLNRTIPYENGKENGLAKLYDTLGNIIGTIDYRDGYVVKREYINRTDPNGMKQGYWKSFWENGNLMVEGYYQNGKKNGFFKYYNVDGYFLEIEKWEHDILIEDATETKQLERQIDYHPNGKIKTIAYFYKGIPDGVRREYTPDGTVLKSYIFRNGILMGEGIVDDNGRKQGDWKEFYETGALRAAGKYINSKPTGQWKYYFENGKIEITGAYTRKGEKEGEWIWYYPNGDILSIENYLTGLLDGESFTLSIAGDTLEHGMYAEGMEEGRWIYRNDSVRVEGSYLSGKKEGNWKTYYPNGKLKRIESYFNDELDGISLFYWENAIRKAEYTYINGLLNGNAYLYDKEGAISLTTTYRMGVEIRYDGVKVTPEIDLHFE